MTLTFTDWAVDILRRSHETARRYQPDAAVWLRRTGGGVAFELTDEPPEGARRIAGDGFELWADDGLEGTVDVVEPHDQLILRPPGDHERSTRPS